MTLRALTTRQYVPPTSFIHNWFIHIIEIVCSLLDTFLLFYYIFAVILCRLFIPCRIKSSLIKRKMSCDYELFIHLNSFKIQVEVDITSYRAAVAVQEQSWHSGWTFTESMAYVSLFTFCGFNIMQPLESDFRVELSHRSPSPAATCDVCLWIAVMLTGWKSSDRGVSILCFSFPVILAKRQSYLLPEGRHKNKLFFYV